MAVSFLAIPVVYAVIAARQPHAGRRLAGVPGAVWVSILLLLVLGVLNQLYAVSNRPIGHLHSVKTVIDAYVPVIPLFVVPYLGLYAAFIFTLAYLAWNRLDRQLRTATIAFCISMTVALITFVIFQTFVPPPADDGIGPFGHLLDYIEKDIYAGDYYSAFPSEHCGYATIVAIAWARLGRRLWTWMAVLFAIAVVLATQLLHQHFFMDAMFGILIAIAAYSAAWWMSERPRLARA
jgi:hypothetical protein